MDLGIMFFGGGNDYDRIDSYETILTAARIADRGNLNAVWTPERHFDEFGGLFPNPAVTSAAIAAVTERIQIRAGSVVSPLHNTIRLAEDWSVVDNLSGGRVALSFGSGWNANDFVLAPDVYDQRKAVMFDQIDLVRHLWAGGGVALPNPSGKLKEVFLTPRPLRTTFPLWLTASSNPETFRRAGELDANLLTHLIFHDLAELRTKIEIYRQARSDASLCADEGRICLMLHTFLGSDRAGLRKKVERPMKRYLKSAVQLERSSATGGGVLSGGKNLSSDELPPDLLEEMLDMTFQRYFDSGSLMGDMDHCVEVIAEVEKAGVDEIACLIDFGVSTPDMLESLDQLVSLAAVVGR